MHQSTPAALNRSRVFANSRMIMLAVTILLAGINCCGWSISRPYTDDLPLVVEPGDAGWFHILLIPDDPQGVPFPVFGAMDHAWFAFGGHSIGAGMVEVVVIPGLPTPVEVLYTIPLAVLPGTYGLAYEFTRIDTREVVSGGFPVIVDGPIGGSAPIVSVTSCGTYEIGVEEVWLEGSVNDPDGDRVDYTWLLDGSPVAGGSVNPPAGEESVTLQPVYVGLGRGTYGVTLVATDGLSDPVEAGCSLVVQDTTAPELHPVAEPGTIRPSKKWQPVLVSVQPTDNSGDTIFLEASVSITGLAPQRKSRSVTPDAYVHSINQATGTVTLMVRPCGKPRTGLPVLEVELSATDASGNTASASISIPVARKAVPHMGGKAKPKPMPKYRRGPKAPFTRS